MIKMILLLTSPLWIWYSLYFLTYLMSHQGSATIIGALFGVAVIYGVIRALNYFLNSIFKI